MSYLHRISGCNNAKRKADLLFIHGLGGDGLSTWRHDQDNSAFWPSWVGIKFPEIGVWSLDYAASPTKWNRFLGWFSRSRHDKGHSMALPDRALQVLDLMVQRGFGQRAIVFVCHSLGGLLTKQILRTSADASEIRERAVFTHTRGLLFLATPHAGADLATIADAFRLIFRGTVSIQDLRAHNPYLRQLYDWYRRHSFDAGIRTLTYYETLSIKGVTIVNPTSAHPGVGADPVGLDEDHISIAKPRADAHQICGALDQLIHDCVLTPQRTDSSIASPEADLPSPTRAQDHVSTSPPLETDLDAVLRDLVARGLLHHDTREGRFDLHPIVRRYAYDRLAAPDRAAAHTRLRDYFAAVPPADEVTRLEDLAPVIELYHHTVRAGQFDEALTLFRDRLADLIYFQFGACQLEIDLLRALFPDGEDRPPRLKTKRSQSWAACALGNSYLAAGQPRRGATLFNVSAELDESEDDKLNLAVDLGNVAMQQVVIGALRTAEANLRRSIALRREIKKEFEEAVGHQDLGGLLAYRGAYAESEAELATALKMFGKKELQSQCVVWAYRALRELLLLRSNPDSALRAAQAALESARRALELADEDARTDHPVERDYIRAHWLLGAAHRVGGELDEAERHLHEALERCRRINLVEAEADILVELARLRAATGAPDEAQRLAEEALVIIERCGYVLQGADARLELAKLALARGDKTAAKEHARKAKDLATCDGPPDYTYKAAYDEAGALLAELGGSS